MKRKLLRYACLGLLAASLCSCASVTVSDISPLSEQPPAHPPVKIFVQPFEFQEDMLRVDRTGEKLDEFKRDLQTEMSKNLVERLRKYIAKAEPLPASAGIPHGNYWLVTGEFTRVNQGSRALRSTVGFGSGGTKMDVTVTVADLTGGEVRPFAMLRTTGGSNAMPGAIMGVISWPMTLSGGEGLIAGVTGDCRRTSREITAGLAAYMREHQLTVAEDAPNPKTKGKPSWWPQKKPAN